MGILSFLNKFFKDSEVEEVIIEKLAFSEIGSWIENKVEENEVKQTEILVLIKGKIGTFTEGVKGKIVELESVDVGAKKEKDDLKGIVENSRKDYIKSFEDFLESLSDLEMDELEDSRRRINKYFLDFNKGSYKNYERATILIGKEMKNIKDSIKVFSKELVGTFEENKEIIEFFRKISSIKSKLDEIPSLDKTLGKIDETKLSLNERIKNKEGKHKELLEEVVNVKKSPDYLNRLETQKKVEFLKEELKNDLFLLKQFIDFKALANFFHINQEQLKALKEHQEDFQTNFQKDNGKMILDFLDEAKLNNNQVLEKVGLIRAKIGKASQYKSEIKEDETLKLDPQIKSVTLEIDSLKIEKAKEEKRRERIGMDREKLNDLLKEEFEKMNVVIVSE